MNCERCNRRKAVESVQDGRYCDWCAEDIREDLGLPRRK